MSVQLFVSYHFIYPKSYQFAHIVEGDGQLSVESLAVCRGDQPAVLCLAVYLQFYHSSVNGRHGRLSK